MKLAGAGALGAAVTETAAAEAPWSAPHGGRVWETLELTFHGPDAGNPFVDTQLTASFTLGHRSVAVDGFYDGNGAYKVRFLPDTAGAWRYQTHSNTKALDELSGDLHIDAAGAGTRGLVSVANQFHFSYADGTPFLPFGTTCYAWIHQSEALQQATLRSLAASPFNKIRMCVFPKNYQYNHNEPPFYPFPRSAEGTNDYTRFNPEFFAHLEQRIRDLARLGIEADLILFHPYDRWGYSKMPAEADDRYLRYILARLSAFPNIWWSLANEFDLMHEKKTADFDRFFHIVEQHDPYSHLRSVHYSHTMYDYTRPWVTHASIQTYDFVSAQNFRDTWHKPVVYDEVQYEGNLNSRWGNLSGEEMTRRFWLGVINGCYVTHGETFLPEDAIFHEDATPTIWWSHGGELHGASPRSIAVLRKLVEDALAEPGVRIGLTPTPNPYYMNATVVAANGKDVRSIFYYFDYHQPIWYEFPLPEGRFTAEFIDPATGAAQTVSGTFSGKSKIRLPGKPFQVMRFRAAKA